MEPEPGMVQNQLKIHKRLRYAENFLRNYRYQRLAAMMMIKMWCGPTCPVPVYCLVRNVCVCMCKYLFSTCKGENIMRTYKIRDLCVQIFRHNYATGLNCSANMIIMYMYLRVGKSANTYFSLNSPIFSVVSEAELLFCLFLSV